MRKELGPAGSNAFFVSRFSNLLFERNTDFHGKTWTRYREDVNQPDLLDIESVFFISRNGYYIPILLRMPGEEVKLGMDLRDVIRIDTVKESFFRRKLNRIKLELKLLKEDAKELRRLFTQ